MEKRIKSLVNKLAGAFLLSLIIMSCSKTANNTDSVTMKQALTESSANLKTAMTDIASSQAFQLFTMDGAIMKSTADALYKVYIVMDSVKGEYDYHPVIRKNHWGISLLQFFTKTANNSQMIVRMPLAKVKNPRILREYRPADSTLTNNFSIAVSNYHNNYNGFHDYDYNLVSEINVDDKKAGDLSIKSIVSPKNNVHYGSQFVFSDKYTAKYAYVSGDTTVSSFAILDAGKTLYEEKLLTIKKVKTDTARFGREHLYSLTIGNVQIVRYSATKTVEVYVDGVLQPNAKVTIIDKVVDPEASVCKKRDIQITFEDGTTTTVSTLIGAQIDNIKALFTSLHQVYFAAYIVDWVAYDIYYQK